MVFIGDSQVRQIFWVMAAKLDRENAEYEFKRIADKHTDHVVKGPDNLQLDFIWDPYLNSTRLSDEIAMASSETADTIRGNSSSLTVIGGGLWFAKNLGGSSLQQFGQSVETILHTAEGYDRTHTQLRSFPVLPQSDPTSSLTMFLPAQKPLYVSLDSDHARTITPDRVETLHQNLLQASSQRRTPILWAYDKMTNHSETYQSDGLHFKEEVVTAIADLILNAKCNSFLTATKGYPMDKICCSKYPPLKKTQSVLIHATWIFPAAVWFFPTMLSSISSLGRGYTTINDWSLNQSDKLAGHIIGLLSLMPTSKTFKATFVILWASCYCWLADRTHLYNKAQKHYSQEDFRSLCFMTLLVGILSLRRSKTPNRQKSDGSDATKEDLFLSRDQTDEWKGWMQIMILIYHYTGASKVLWIYKIIRLLVASYLFLTGYGHTIFFHTKADFSLKRVAGVLVRLNTLSCILPYVMETDYLFYYFAPLVSFWYVVVYATMAVGKSWNKSLLLLTIKIVTSAILVTKLISLEPSLFETIFSMLSKFCNIQWDAADWQFRLGLDKYIVFVGMLVAAYTVTNKGKSTLHWGDLEDIVDPATSDLTFGDLGQSFLHGIHLCLGNKDLIYLTTTCGGCVYYTLFAYTATDKNQHNNIFSTASIGPILAFVAIRNYFFWTRRFHSSIFAWIGRHSLETFVLQFHIWLAADTKGLLSTGLFDRSPKEGKWLDFILLTTIFLWVCWHTADAIQALSLYIVDPRPVQRDCRSGTSLPMAKSDEALGARTLRGKEDNFRWNAANYIARRAGSALSLPKSLIEKSLAARLLLILGIFWCLNMM